MKNAVSTWTALLHSLKGPVVRIALLCLLGVLLLAAPTALSKAAPTSVWYVDAATGSDGFDCQSPGAACETIGAAVGKASPGDTIQVAAGVYTENIELQDLTLIGAGPDSTILDGGHDDRVLRTLLEVRVVGVTIRNGRLTGDSDLFASSGAGIRNSGTLMLEDTRVISNTTEGSGAGIFNSDTVILAGAEIRGNAAEGVGGGIYNYGVATLVTATNSLITHNTANQGAGVYSSAPLVLRDSMLRGNRAGLFGGGLTMFGGTADLAGVTVEGNWTEGYGAGVLNNGGALTMTNTTVTENTAQHYSGLANISALAESTIVNSTIVNNRRSSSAGNTAGGIGNISNATLSVRNTIVAGNDVRDCSPSGDWTSQGHNLSSDDSCQFTQAGDRQNLDPELGPLARYGGQTLTYALLVGSPAIDAGDDVGCPAADQRGLSRPVDGDNDGMASCDIGSFEARHQLSIEDTAVGEGNAGTVDAVFEVTLAPTSTGPISVSYATAEGTAFPGVDYEPTSGVLVFQPGTTTQHITVTVYADTEDEPDETWHVDLLNAPEADLIDGRGTGTIVDDDGLSSLVIGDESIAEGDTDPVAAAFLVTLSPTSTAPVTVDYATADATAAAGSDYEAVADTLSFLPGETTKTITVTVYGDNVDEGESEKFAVDLSGATNATLADDQAWGTILDDDAATIRIGSGPDVLEGDSGESPAEFQVELTMPTAFTVTVDYYTSDGVGVGGAIAGEDYVATSGTLEFAPGETTLPINVPIKGDEIVEPDEIYYVRLSNPDPIPLQIQSSSGRILNDDDEAGPEESLVFLSVVLRAESAVEPVGVNAQGPSGARRPGDGQMGPPRHP